MNMTSLIEKKKRGEVLSKEEISFLIKGYTADEIPDYQVSAFLMAVWFNGMSLEETVDLTDAMRFSGDVIDLSAIKGIKVDKHSTGGVGDKTSMIIGPIAASVGVKVPKMSGRGLGFTGGTVDKLESIPGFRTEIDEDEFIDIVNRVGLAIIGQTKKVVPADKKIYALRDVTQTVDNISLIASSVMSKKLASGSDKIVLDVKNGDGAFMESLEEAVKLAELMVLIGKKAGKETIALITDMEEPLGHYIGNGLEVMESIMTLKGEGPEDLLDLSLSLSAYMVHLSDKNISYEEGRTICEDAVKSGKALSKMKEFIEAQGGNPKVIEDFSLLPTPAYDVEIEGPLEDGYVYSCHAKTIGIASQMSGAGRMTKEEDIDLSAGIILHKKTGDFCKKGEPFGVCYGNNLKKVQEAAKEAAKAFTLGPTAPSKKSVVLKVIK
ncbi:MAG: thymidine phosphorylase [Anaerovoracaceae bacterium]